MQVRLVKVKAGEKFIFGGSLYELDSSGKLGNRMIPVKDVNTGNKTKLGTMTKVELVVDAAPVEEVSDFQEEEEEEVVNYYNDIDEETEDEIN